MNSIKWASCIFVLFLPSLTFPQNLVDGIDLYNRARYDSVINYFAPNFLRNHPEEDGVGRYFLAESYYNKALQESNPERIRFFLRKAWKGFKYAGSNADLDASYNEYFHFAKYKIGWCSYRLAELNASPIAILNRAHREFMSISDQAPDSIKIFSLFMAGESKERENILRSYRLLANRFNAHEFNEIIESYATLNKLYDEIIETRPTFSSSANLDKLKAVLKIKKEQINFHVGKLYQTLTPDDFSTVNDPKKKSNINTTALHYFRAIDYDPAFTISLLNSNSQSMILYLTLMNGQHQYFVQRSQSAKNRLQQGWSRIKGKEFESERFFRLGNLYHGNPDIDSDEFSELAARAYAASSKIGESYYWLAYLQMIQNQNHKSRQNFTKYISLTENEKSISQRQRYLLEDAQYRKYLLDFELFYLANKIKEMKKLAKNIKAFSVNSEVIQNRKEVLNLLINSSLTRSAPKIWSEVLTGSDDEKLEQAFNTIHFILPRAAMNIGRTRERYIFLLNRLFEVTASRKSDETLFFQGIVESLEAEIQATPKEKIEKFMKAAITLNQIQSDFALRNEANYIRAKCLFFANEFDKAMSILKELVNRHKYLRALFYMGEIFRLDNNGLAARRCYEIITRKLQDSRYDYDKFWVENSIAALSAISNTGNIAVLDSIRVEDVVFQPSVQPNNLFYEKLADERILSQKYMRESLTWMLKFGLPEKTLYPSGNRLNHSLFVAENTFEQTPYAIDEVRPPLTASLRMQVIVPTDVGPEIEVRVGGDIPDCLNGIYFQHLIPLNSELEITVENPECYDYRTRYRFAKVGENNFVVVLSKKLDFKASKNIKNIFDSLNYPLRPRWDTNFILNDIPVQSDESELIRDFSQNYNLRDWIVDKIGDRILAVSAEENNIWIYSNDAFGKRVGTLKMNPGNLLNSPEGIAVDSAGRIYLADWGNHRVLQFSGEGSILRKIGSFGTNNSVRHPVKLAFPTRVAILEDVEGIRIGEKSFYRESYLCVADMNGIQICMLDGTYLGTILAPTGNFPPGSFYAFTFSGYGEKSKLHLINRLGDLQGQIFEFTTN